MLRILQQFVITTLFAVLASQASAMFIQPDWFDPTHPGVGTNRYAYSFNDPVNLRDPNGNYIDDLGIEDQDEADDYNRQKAQSSFDRAREIREGKGLLNALLDALGADDKFQRMGEDRLARVGMPQEERMRIDGERLGFEITTSFVPRGAKPEVFYRSVSPKDYATFLKTGKLPGTGETTITQRISEAAKYDGVTLRIETRPGTLAGLEGLGVRAPGKMIAERYPGMRPSEAGWNRNFAQFKQENDGININLGNGLARDYFNVNIIGATVIKR